MATSYINESLTIGATSSNVSNDMGSLNLKRTSIIITNTSLGGQIISLAVGKEAEAGAGLVLYPGGSWEQTLNGSYLPPQQKISAISSAAGGTISHYEEVL